MHVFKGVYNIAAVFSKKVVPTYALILMVLFVIQKFIFIYLYLSIFSCMLLVFGIMLREASSSFKCIYVCILYIIYIFSLQYCNGLISYIYIYNLYLSICMYRYKSIRPFGPNRICSRVLFNTIMTAAVRILSDNYFLISYFLIK